MYWVTEREAIADPKRPNGQGIITQYMLDTNADVDLLATEVLFDGSNAGSTAFVADSGRILFLTSNGWVDG